MEAMEQFNLQDFILRLSIQLPGFILAVSCHEAAHAFVALKFGDDTAKRQGRLTLNPTAHYTPFGTILFPLLGALMGGTMFGWARPVPIDARRFKNIRKSIFWVSFAGPGANILLSVLSAFFYVLIVTKVSPTFYFYEPFLGMLKASITINCILAVFNLIPFPPLDGSKMVGSFLNYEAQRKFEEIQKYGFIFLLLLWFTNVFSYLLFPAIMMANGFIRLFYVMLS